MRTLVPTAYDSVLSCTLPSSRLPTKMEQQKQQLEIHMTEPKGSAVTSHGIGLDRLRSDRASLDGLEQLQQRPPPSLWAVEDEHGFIRFERKTSIDRRKTVAGDVYAVTSSKEETAKEASDALPLQRKKGDRRRKMHNTAERRRRNRHNEKLKELRRLLPNAAGLNQASLLDEAISYIESYQKKQAPLPMDPNGALSQQHSLRQSSMPYMPMLPSLGLTAAMPLMQSAFGMNYPAFYPPLASPCLGSSMAAGAPSCSMSLRRSLSPAPMEIPFAAGSSSPNQQLPNLSGNVDERDPPENSKNGSGD